MRFIYIISKNENIKNNVIGCPGFWEESGAEIFFVDKKSLSGLVLWKVESPLLLRAVHKGSFEKDVFCISILFT